MLHPAALVAPKLAFIFFTAYFHVSSLPRLTTAVGLIETPLKRLPWEAGVRDSTTVLMLIGRRAIDWVSLGVPWAQNSCQRPNVVFLNERLLILAELALLRVVGATAAICS